MLTNYTIEGFENIQYQGFHALSQIEKKLNKLFYTNGYTQVATPTFEAYDFFATGDTLPCDDLFKLINHQGKVLALKPDATLPIARMAAINHHDPKEIIKFCYRTNIYRNFSSPDIVKKEITQMGVEYFGNDQSYCDAEIIALAIQSLQIHGIQDIHIDLGHVGFINCLFDAIQLEDPQRKFLLKLIETKNLGDIQEFLSNTNLDSKIKSIILRLPRLYGNPQSVLVEMESLCINKEMEAVIIKLRNIFEDLEIMGYKDYISFDLGFTSQMNYYSDLIFKGYVSNWGEPLIVGGRYNHLSNRFGINRPACGFGVDVLQLMDYLEQNQKLPQSTHTRRILFYSPNDKKEAYQLLTQLRYQYNPMEGFLIQSSLEESKKDLLKNALYNDSIFYALIDGIQYLDIKGKFTAIDNILEKDGE